MVFYDGVWFRVRMFKRAVDVTPSRFTLQCAQGERLSHCFIWRIKPATNVVLHCYVHSEPAVNFPALRLI